MFRREAIVDADDPETAHRRKASHDMVMGFDAAAEPPAAVQIEHAGAMGACGRCVAAQTQWSVSRLDEVCFHECQARLLVDEEKRSSVRQAASFVRRQKRHVDRRKGRSLQCACARDFGIEHHGARGS